MSELSHDPPRLRAILAYLERQLGDNETVGIYLRMQRDAVCQALAGTEQPAPEPAPARKRPARNVQPRPLHTFTARAVGNGGSTGFTVEQRTQAVGPERVLIHVDDCLHAGATWPIDPHGARASLLEGLEACPFCRPDGELEIETD
ncbi:DUF6233 domain-containing protein [Streptomyces sp. NPDC055722]